ncbi:MAG: AMP-binding protein [Chitinispirillaceae bacterium]
MDYLLHQLLMTSEQQFETKTAVADQISEISYSEFASRSAFVAQRLLDAGLRRGDRVAVYCNHSIDLAVSIFAISAAGGVFVPINHQLFPTQIRHILCDSEAKFLLTHKRMPVKSGELTGNNQLPHRSFFMEELVGEAKLQRHTGAIENDLAAILYTSGSTGLPKGVMLSHRNLIAGSQIVSEYLGLSKDDRLLGILPLSFDYGLNQLITMVANGGTYRFFSFNWPNEIVDALESFDITGLAGVPSLWILLSRSRIGNPPLPHLRYITNSGGAIPVPVLELLRKKIPDTDVVLMYGLTEAFRSTFLPPTELEKRPTSMGKAIPNTEIFVVSEDGKLCAPNEPGILVHRGPTVALGYWKKTQETQERFRTMELAHRPELQGERVVYSGDIVRMDEQGFLYFMGRRDAMIKSSGYRISPTEIEGVAFKSGLIKEVAAIGYKHETVGQRIKLMVVPVGEEPDIEQRLISFCSRNVPSYMVPGAVELVDAIPKTPTGKIDYPLLYRQTHGANEMERKNADHGHSQTVA